MFQYSVALRFLIPVVRFVWFVIIAKLNSLKWRDVFCYYNDRARHFWKRGARELSSYCMQEKNLCYLGYISGIWGEMKWSLQPLQVTYYTVLAQSSHSPHVETGICIKREILRRLQVMCKLFHLKGLWSTLSQEIWKTEPFFDYSDHSAIFRLWWVAFLATSAKPLIQGCHWEARGSCFFPGYKKCGPNYFHRKI